MSSRTAAGRKRLQAPAKPPSASKPSKTTRSIKAALKIGLPEIKTSASPQQNGSLQSYSAPDAGRYDSDAFDIVARDYPSRAESPLRRPTRSPGSDSCASPSHRAYNLSLIDDAAAAKSRWSPIPGFTNASLYNPDTVSSNFQPSTSSRSASPAYTATASTSTSTNGAYPITGSSRATSSTAVSSTTSTNTHSHAKFSYVSSVSDPLSSPRIATPTPISSPLGSNLIIDEKNNIVLYPPQPAYSECSSDTSSMSSSRLDSPSSTTVNVPASIFSSSSGSGSSESNSRLPAASAAAAGGVDVKPAFVYPSSRSRARPSRSTGPTKFNFKKKKEKEKDKGKERERDLWVSTGSGDEGRDSVMMVGEGAGAVVPPRMYPLRIAPTTSTTSTSTSSSSSNQLKSPISPQSSNSSMNGNGASKSTDTFVFPSSRSRAHPSSPPIKFNRKRPSMMSTSTSTSASASTGSGSNVFSVDTDTSSSSSGARFMGITIPRRKVSALSSTASTNTNSSGGGGGGGGSSGGGRVVEEPSRASLVSSAGTGTGTTSSGSWPGQSEEKYQGQLLLRRRLQREGDVDDERTGDVGGEGEGDIDKFPNRENTEWLRRYSSKVGMYPLDPYDAVLLDSDHHTQNLLRRLNTTNTPSFHHYGNDPPATVLDLGCGQGYWVLEAAVGWKGYGTKVTGFDMVDVLKNVRVLAGRYGVLDNIKFVKGNFLKAPLPFANESFDMVRLANLTYAISYDKWEFVLREVCRVLTVGGRVELIDDHVFFPYGKPALDMSVGAMSDGGVGDSQRDNASVGLEEEGVEEGELYDLYGDGGREEGEGEGEASDTATLSGKGKEMVSPRSGGRRQLPQPPVGQRPHPQSQPQSQSQSQTHTPTPTPTPTRTYHTSLSPIPIPIPTVESQFWNDQMLASKQLEKLFEHLMNLKFGIHLCPSEFLLEMMKGVFGHSSEVRTMHLTVAPPVGVQQQQEVGAAEAGDGQGAGQGGGGVGGERKKEEKGGAGFDFERHDVAIMASTSVESRATTPTSTTTPIPSYTASTSSSSTSSSSSSSSVSSSTSPSLYSSSSTPTSPPYVPHPLSPSPSTTTLSTTSESESTLLDLSPGLVLWPSTFLPMTKGEIKAHASRHAKVLLGCRAALGEYAVEIAEIEDGDVEEEGVLEALWEYEGFLYQRFDPPPPTTTTMMVLPSRSGGSSGSVSTQHTVNATATANANAAARTPPRDRERDTDDRNSVFSVSSVSSDAREAMWEYQFELRHHFAWPLDAPESTAQSQVSGSGSEEKTAGGNGHPPSNSTVPIQAWGRQRTHSVSSDPMTINTILPGFESVPDLNEGAASATAAAAGVVAAEDPARYLPARYLGDGGGMYGGGAGGVGGVGSGSGSGVLGAGAGGDRDRRRESIAPPGYSVVEPTHVRTFHVYEGIKIDESVLGSAI